MVVVVVVVVVVQAVVVRPEVLAQTTRCFPYVSAEAAVLNLMGHGYRLLCHALHLCRIKGIWQQRIIHHWKIDSTVCLQTGVRGQIHLNMKVLTVTFTQIAIELR
jgi:hypothetical protein